MRCVPVAPVIGSARVEATGSRVPPTCGLFQGSVGFLRTTRAPEADGPRRRRPGNYGFLHRHHRRRWHVSAPNQEGIFELIISSGLSSCNESQVDDCQRSPTAPAFELSSAAVLTEVQGARASPLPYARQRCG